MTFGFLHYPSLNQFTLLSGITTVYDFRCFSYKAFDDVELAFDALLINELNAKLRRNHRKCTKRPPFPQIGVVGRLFECTQVTKSPCHFILPSLIVSVTFDICAENGRNIFCNTGFLCYTKYHSRLLFKCFCFVPQLIHFGKCHFI